MVRRRPLRRSVLIVVLGSLVAAGAAQADPAGHATATHGSVTATLTWKAGGADIGGVSDPHLTITRAGTVAFDATLAQEDCAACSFLTGVRGRTTPVAVVDLDGDGEPEVLVDTYSGGAHCCFADLIYRFDGSSYTHTQALWGDGSAAVRDLDGDGKPELVTVADMFAYAFTSYADSYLPILIESYNAGKLTDVTFRFPAQVRADATHILKLIASGRRHKRDLRGLVAAYVADEDTLGRKAASLTFLSKERKRGDLGSKRRARAFEKALAKFLAKYGYT